MSLMIAMLSGCLHDLASVSYVTLHSQAQGREMRYAVHTPTAWDGATPLPMVVLLHGAGDDETVLERHPAIVRRIDAWIARGLLPPFVLVAPNGERGFWANWADGSQHYADWVTREVMPDVRKRFPIAGEKAALVGISMGGAGALYLGLDYPELFSSMSAWSAPIYPRAAIEAFFANPESGGFIPVSRVFGTGTPAQIAHGSLYDRVMSTTDLQGVRLLIGAGSVDLPGMRRMVLAWHEHLLAAGVAHDLLMYQGGHRWADWSRVIPVALCLRLRGEACVLPKARGYRLTRAGG